MYRVVAGATEDEEVDVLPEQYAPLMDGESESPPRAQLPVMMQRAFTAEPTTLPQLDGSATPKHGTVLSLLSIPCAVVNCEGNLLLGSWSCHSCW